VLGVIQRSRQALADQRASEATSLLKEALADDEPPGTLARSELLKWLGLSYKAQGEYGKARGAFEEALELRENQGGCLDVSCVELLTELGNVAMSGGDPDASLAYLERSVSVAEAADGEDGAATLRSWLLLGSAHALRNEPRRAEKAFRKAIEIAEKRQASADDDLQAALFNLAEVVRKLGRTEEAARLVERGMKLSPAQPQ